MNQPDTLADLSGRASLRKRFPGLDAQIGRVVGEMVDHIYGEKPFHVYYDIQPQIPQGFNIATSWHVHIVARGTAIKLIDESGQIRMPVIPDEFNTRPGGLIKAEDRPYDFRSMQGAERAAEDAVDAMNKTLRKLLGVKK